MTPSIVTLLTDFGDRDTFVGQMKGILLSYSPDAKLVDLTHQVSAQSTVEGGFHLAAAWRAFPPGTVHLAVVDPGVGTKRRAISVTFCEQYFVLPDNGLISAVLNDEEADRAVQISYRPESEPGVSRTFHGRDVFAPAAGRLASGMALDEIGTSIDPATVMRLELPRVDKTARKICGEIILIDHFGNAITNVDESSLRSTSRWSAVSCGRFAVSGVSLTYQDVEPGDPLALVSSMGTLELAVRDGSAASQFGIAVGMRVTLSN